MLLSAEEQVPLQRLSEWNLKQVSTAKYCVVQVTKLILNGAAKTPLYGMALGFISICLYP